MPLTLEQYDAWVQSELEKILRPVRAKASKLLDETVRVVRESKDFFQNLSAKAEREMNTKRDAASYRAARLIGHGAGQALDQVNQIQTKQDVNWENLKVVRNDLSISVRSLRDIRDRTGSQLSGFYILDMRSFSGIVERLAKNGERLAAFLDSDGSNLQKARTINGIIESMKDARQNVVTKHKEAIALEKQKIALEDSIKGLSDKSEKLASSALLAELLSIEKELRKESRNFRTETLAHLQRPIRRLREISERGEYPIEAEQRAAIALYLKTPYKSLLSPDTGRFLKPILENMKSAVDSGKMEFKPKKTARIANQLKQLITTNHLLDIQKRGLSLLERRRELLKDSECHRMYIERKQLLSETGSRKEELDALEAKLGSTYDTLHVFETRVSELAGMAENKTREYLRQNVQLERSAAPVTSNLVNPTDL